MAKDGYAQVLELPTELANYVAARYDELKHPNWLSMDSNITVYAEPISEHNGKMTAYAVTRVDNEGMPIDTYNVWDEEMSEVVNECNVNGWELIVR